VAVVRAVEALTPKRPAVKWVNDLYLDGAKLAGILAEGILPPDGPPRIAVGVGINLTTRAFPEGLRAPATSLAAEGEPAPDINALAARIAEELLDAAEGNPCAPDRLADYRRRCYLTGKAVVCTRGDTRLEGVAEGIGDDYALLIRTPTGELIRVTEGEATVRVAEG
jgi:BirA family biotin operon repressor/biotin-[acetyl-CoA-carboxylase] ligase